ncbi:type A2 lantipeptide [Streptomyces sp. ISL-98]|uniref:type A2 lantipeptide n=1 Tax=Streptomyces sp. ISL-98 TaxID=2819192 RepID=UPI001BE54BEB|nr:type A2 lantipeptide [Streptomyces sp. ISL-98]MBT2510387.1 type A2 lantipeptide [Streptomyces sp. ISL-98]
MNFSQVATQEISDNDLDNVSGGLLGGVVANSTSALDGIAGAGALAASAVSTVEGVTGLNTAPVAGIATATVAGV